MVWMPIATGVPPLICEADFQPSTVASMVRSSRPFCGRRQAGVREIAIEALLLALFRAVRGHHQVADLGVERRRGGEARIDHATRVLLTDAEFDLHRRAVAGSPASGMVMVKLPDGGIFIASIDQRPPSSGRTLAVVATSPLGLVRPGIGQVRT